MKKQKYIMTEEHKKKIGLANAIKTKLAWANGKFDNTNVKELLSNYNKKRKEKLGYVNSPETRKKLSAIMKEKYRTGDVSQKQLDLQKDITKYGHQTIFKQGHSVSKEIREKVSKKTTDFYYSHPEKQGQWKEFRSKQVFPIKDTKIEVKIQDYLKQLDIEFFTHIYMREIEHAYQCDILIPVQKGINQKTIIECYGDYWHHRPYGNPQDAFRCQELREKGYRVLVFWESEIKPMEFKDFQGVLTTWK
jgi:G:T-mismatch repair DNA endonuclease (very short patch repair protein)